MSGIPQLFGKLWRRVVGFDCTIEDLELLDFCPVYGQVPNWQKDRQCCPSGVTVGKKSVVIDPTAYTRDICEHAVETPGCGIKKTK